MTFLCLAVKVTRGAPSACLQGPWKRSLAPVLCTSLPRCSPRLQKLAPRPGPGGQRVPYLASEGLLSRMLQGVHLEGHAALERLSTGLARKGHVFRVRCNTERTTLRISPPKSSHGESFLSYCQGTFYTLICEAVIATFWRETEITRLERHLSRASRWRLLGTCRR